ncbi:hypothetical protein ACJX0J_020391, partial [Zea mays]
MIVNSLYERGNTILIHLRQVVMLKFFYILYLFMQLSHDLKNKKIVKLMFYGINIIH